MERPGRNRRVVQAAPVSHGNPLLSRTQLLAGSLGVQVRNISLLFCPILRCVLSSFASTLRCTVCWRFERPDSIRSLVTCVIYAAAAAA